MRFNYLLYPSALEKIRQSGIGKRVKKLKESEDGLPYIGGAIFDGDLVRSVQDLKERGFYEHLPSDFVRLYKETMNGILKGPEDFFWTIQRPVDTTKEPCNLEDLLLFSGELASMVLKPDEIWEYSKFGFSSPSEFVTTVSTFIMQQSKAIFREGYKWTRKRDDGSGIVTEITGDDNSDLRIYQTDIAPYTTIDPFGSAIEMRPEIDADKHTVAAYHTTEGSLLVVVMKYIEQQGILAEYQKDEAKKIIEWGRSLGQGGGTCTEHFEGFEENPMMFFVAHGIPIPQLNERNETEQHTTFWLPTAGEGAYGGYISQNGDFVLSYQSGDSVRNPAKPVSMRFLPEDAEYLVKGLIYQSAKGLGRTSAKQILDILAYRYSSKFEEDQEKFKQ
ncbi:hypothetical protein K8R33_01455 [archaeon]|nr:hypothetical protein [archaeon]